MMQSFPTEFNPASFSFSIRMNSFSFPLKHLLHCLLLGSVYFTMSSSFGDEKHDNPVSDPFIWLENVTGKRPLDWVRKQNAKSEKQLTDSSAFEKLEQRLLGILDSKERIPMISKIGRYFYNFWRDADNPKGIWRRTSMEQYRRNNPAWETVLDLDALAKRDNENWVWHGVRVLKPEDRFCLVSLSRGGADADVVREFDLETKSFVAGGFSLPEAKSWVSWKTKNTLLVATDFGPESLTTSGYPRTVREWDRGTNLENASILYEGLPEDMSVVGWHDPTPGYERSFVTRQMTFWTDELFLQRNGHLIKIQKPDDANAVVHRDWLLIELRSDWTRGTTTYKAGSLLAANLERFLALGDSTTLDVLYEPTERTSLVAFSTTRNNILLKTLDNVRSRIFILHYHDGTWHKEPLPGIPDVATASISAVDGLESDDYFLTTATPLSPTILSFGTLSDNRRHPLPEKLKQSPSFFKSDGLTVQQYETTSQDGTRIPYFQIGPKHLPHDGSTPTLLYGYGGFEIPLLPSYNSLTGAAWLEQGNVYVVANIRGGGEFGPKWHQAALKNKRPRAYEDFIAVAEDLIRRKVTSQEHLGVKGGSNGGLLVGNMYTMRPDLFGAVVCQVPLLDMQRFHKLLAGASWIGEYGNPDIPEEWQFIKRFSPYHNFLKTRSYPPILITTSTRDDRVHPGHARKMAALLESADKSVLYYENIEGGHGGAANNQQRAFMDAMAWSFLETQLK